MGAGEGLLLSLGLKEELVSLVVWTVLVSRNKWGQSRTVGSLVSYISTPKN
jgi:hypothetical protein